jgi:peptide/nickel transport system permease protein
MSGAATLPPRAAGKPPGRRLPRLRTIGRQIVSGLLTLFVISIVAFGMMSVRGPSQIAHEKFGNQITPEQVDAFAHEYGLDAPVYERYGKWLWDFAHGDMGTSFVTDVAVSDNVIPRFERTLILSLVSLLIALPISIVLGVFQARRLGSWSDLSLLTGSVVVAALPEFVVGIGLLYLFAVKLGWVPVDSATALTFASSFGDQAKAYILPAVTLVLAIVPYVARIARGSVREALGAPYTQAAVLRGLSPRTVIWDHAMRNAGVPLVNAVAINIVYLLSGVIVVEWVFAFPGIGQGLVQATSTSDAFNVEAIALLMGAMFIGVSLAADLLVAYLNPRLKAAAVR